MRIKINIYNYDSRKVFTKCIPLDIYMNRQCHKDEKKSYVNKKTERKITSVV